MENERIQFEEDMLGIYIFDYTEFVFFTYFRLFYLFSGEQDMNYAEEIHQTNVLSLLDQDFIDVIIHCQISYICFILIWF